MGGSISKREREVISSGKRRRRAATRGENEEREAMVLAWRKERKRLKEEVKRLRKKVKEKEQVEEWECVVVKQMILERALRDEAVERWKNLYLAIKNQLDDLIQTTYGEGLQWRPDEEGVKTIEELRQELEVKEETIGGLKERVALMEKQQYGNQREIDLLRQSSRIISSQGISKKEESSPSSRNLSMFRNTCVDRK
ncbi:PREDICTED: uncharacterized protein LOC104821627 [Tarenaya hassleriana]|uniref:uncharacterized protein LOC104821627 n=1 Tax=Tarenaya hassleriana TaxID=28532 RepID=UPI00053C7094|nr:PREDICTED: uncharacterized protein LOC104821627 [Tarenaya hassleriana]